MADPSGRQLALIRDYLRAHPEVRYVWCDVLCLQQGQCTPEEKAAFKLRMLPNVNMVYLGASVLVLLDELYLSRFWCLFECWLAFSAATAEHGLVTASPERRRATITCLDASAPAAIEAFWSDCSASVAHSKLSGGDIYVTNGSDKLIQLQKIAQLDNQVRRVLMP